MSPRLRSATARLRSPSTSTATPSSPQPSCVEHRSSTWTPPLQTSSATTPVTASTRSFVKCLLLATTSSTQVVAQPPRRPVTRSSRKMCSQQTTFARLWHSSVAQTWRRSTARTWVTSTQTCRTTSVRQPTQQRGVRPQTTLTRPESTTAKSASLSRFVSSKPPAQRCSRTPLTVQVRAEQLTCTAPT